jgi:hypothetical protein
MADKLDCRVVNVNASTAAQNLILAAPTTIGGTGVGHIIVWQVLLGGAGANTLQFQSGNTNLGLPITFTGAGSAATLQDTTAPWFTTKPGEALNLTLTTTAAVTGQLYYTYG